MKLEKVAGILFDTLASVADTVVYKIMFPGVIILAFAKLTNVTVGSPFAVLLVLLLVFTIIGGLINEKVKS